MHHPTDRIIHTTAFVTPVVEHWLEREIAQWVHPMKDRSDDQLHHERTLYLWATSRSPLDLKSWGVKEIVVLKIFPRLRFRNISLLVYASRRIALDQEMVSKVKGEEGVTFHNIKRVQAKNLLSEGLHLGRKGMIKYVHELKWLIKII